MTISIVEVQPVDAAPLKDFMGRVIAASVRGDALLLAELRANVEGNVDWWLAHPDDAVHLKAMHEERLAGVILVKQFWNLCSLFVEPGLQRQGVGRALLQEAVLQCRGRSPKGALWLNAAPDAIAFYRRMGFTERTPTRPLPPGFAAFQLPL
jgi:GNAT superfamily N-acetyltransferase